MKFRLIIIFTLATACCWLRAQSPDTDSLQKLLSTTKSSERIAILSKLTWTLRDSNLRQALDYGLRNLTLIQEEKQEKLLAQANNYVGIIYRNMGDYPQAMSYYYKALRFSQKHDLPLQKAYSYNNIGEILKLQNNLTDAEVNIRRAIELFAQIKNERGEAYGFLRLGEVLQQQKRYEEAMKAFFNAHDIREGIVINSNLDVVLHRIGVLYGKQGKYADAMSFLRRALNLNVDKQDIRGVCSMQNDIASIYLLQNNLPEVIKFAKQSLKQATLIKAKPIICTSAKLLQQTYAKQQNFTKAYDYQQIYIDTMDDFLSEQRGNQMDALRFSHQLEKKQAELNLKNKDILLLQQAQKQHNLRRNLVYALFAAIFLLVSFMTLLFRGNQRKQRANFLLQNRNQEIAEKNYEIIVQNKELHSQQEEIRAQHDSIELQNRHITQSIKAAKTIQEAILPQAERIRSLFERYFVIYRPRDVVSGDFYWAGKVGNKRIVGAIDCTGHGVPGAFMSMIGYALLNEIINTKKITNPGEVLTQLREEVKQALCQEVTRNKDGMDAGLVAIEDQGNNKVKVEFAGAKRPLWYLEKNSLKMQIVDGSRISIGLTYQDNRVIETKELLLDKGSKLYLSSDGFADQNNVNRRKFGSKRLTELIYLIGKYPLDKQKQVLDNGLDEFMKGTEQRDDILLIGIQV